MAEEEGKYLTADQFQEGVGLLSEKAPTLLPQRDNFIAMELAHEKFCKERGEVYVPKVPKYLLNEYLVKHNLTR
jgi:hypothetical protein